MPGLIVSELPEAPVFEKPQDAPKNSERVEKLVAILKPTIPPKGHRYGFYMALTGFFAKQLLPLSEAKAVVLALCDYTGAVDKIGERLTLCETSYGKHAAGTLVAGLDGLEEAFRHSVGAQARIVVEAVSRAITPIGTKEEKDTTPGDERPQPTLECNGEEKLAKTTQNRMAFNLRTLPEWQGTIRFDVFKRARIAKGTPVALDAETGKWSDTDTRRVKNWFEVHQSVNPSEDMCEAALDLVSKDNCFNSVVDYLDGLPASETGIDQLCMALGLQSDIERKMLRIWLISAVARAYRPGCFVKGALVLQGPQNAGKTTFLRIMFGDDYRVSLNGDLSDDKTIGEKLAGAWVAEIEEAHAVKRTDKDALKRFISSQKDKYRPAYGRHSIEQERTSVIAITTNQTEFLDDETGNVRFYCLRVTSIDLVAVERLRDQVWAEARDAYKAGEDYYLTETKDQNAAAELAKEYEVIDPLEEWVTEKLTGKKTVSVREMIQLAGAIGSELMASKAAHDKTAERRFARALLKAGCRRRKSNGRIVYDVPKEFAEKESKPVAARVVS